MGGKFSMWNAYPNVYNHLLVYPGWQVSRVEQKVVQPAAPAAEAPVKAAPVASELETAPPTGDPTPAPAEPEPALVETTVTVAKYILNRGIRGINFLPLEGGGAF